MFFHFLLADVVGAFIKVVATASREKVISTISRLDNQVLPHLSGCPFVCLSEFRTRPGKLERYLENTGASATAAKPTTKNKNISGISFRALAGALANSFQTKTPQIAETMVAPWPMA